jgi:DNA-binding IscR family transcriptional regulator
MWEMLTNKAKYGLRAMCALASLPQGERLQAHAIADRANVPGKFLETILVDLRRRVTSKATAGNWAGIRWRNRPTRSWSAT